MTSSTGILHGLRVLEIGHFVAAPFCTRLLGDLGADVIKVEPPGGDPVRKWGAQVEERSVWWSLHGRNKRSIALDLKRPESRQIVLNIVRECDILVENFRPGQLTRLGLGPDTLRQVRPDLVIAQISGYGQNGPYRERAAFGVIGEAMGGLRYLTNYPPDETSLPPVRVGVSIGDSIAGLYAAFGVMAELWRRDRVGGPGNTIDVALTESVLSMMEGMLPEYSLLGVIKQPTGGAIATAAPSNAYRTADGEWIIIAANSEPLFQKLTVLMMTPHLAIDERFRDNPARVRNVAALDAAISAWTAQFPYVDLVNQLEAAGIPNSKAYTAADCARDPQYRFRGMVREVADPRLGRILQSGIVPHIPENPGQIRWTGPEIGEHSQEILRDVLGMDQAAITRLKEKGII
jgi:crotonobetainyl-CoA:carnitine CoA-transferase CaiB-like acyl-CoA transferase